MAKCWMMIADGEAGAGAGEAAGAAQPQSPLAGLMMPILLIAIFYFMFLRPQQRKEKERRKTIEQLRAGARVVFAGGLVGTIKEAKEKTFVIECADGACVEALRNSVQGTAETVAQ